MTREEQIKAAAKKTTGLFSYRNGYSTAEDAFIAGAEWADANQPNPWVSVEERLPEIGTVILEAYTIVVELQGVRQEDESIIVSRYDGEFVGDGRVEQMMGGTTCCTTHHWMEIPKIKEDIV